MLQEKFLSTPIQRGTEKKVFDSPSNESNEVELCTDDSGEREADALMKSVKEDLKLVQVEIDQLKGRINEEVKQQVQVQMNQLIIDQINEEKHVLHVSAHHRPNQ